MNLNLQGRRAAVAAATKGLGFAAACALAEEGARVAICGRDAGRVEEAVSRIRGDAIGIVADVSTPPGARGFIEKAAERLEGIDILVCNAGGPPPGAPLATDVAGYLHALNLNLLSTISMCASCVPGMRSRGWGRVVAITSHAVREPSAPIAASSTARAAATAYLKVLSSEIAKDGVTVNSLQPGTHDTDRLRDLQVDTAAIARSIPARTLGSPERFGYIVAFLCSDQASFITGTSLLVDGGASAGLI